MRGQAAKINPAEALALWNAGHSLRSIAAQFPEASRMAASRAIRRAVARGLGEKKMHKYTYNGGGRKRTLAEVEREHILRTWDRANRNVALAAKWLHVPLRTLYRRLHEYGITS